jgi:hypothetical protein
MASIEREVENGLLNAVSGVSGLNKFTSERGNARTMPYVLAQASITNEQLGVFTGVFGLSASLTYVARADDTSRQAFDSKYQSLVNELYRNPNLPAYMTGASNITVYQAKVIQEEPTINATNRSWQKAVTLDIVATAKK